MTAIALEPKFTARNLVEAAFTHIDLAQGWVGQDRDRRVQEMDRAQWVETQHRLSELQLRDLEPLYQVHESWSSGSIARYTAEAIYCLERIVHGTRRGRKDCSPACDLVIRPFVVNLLKHEFGLTRTGDPPPDDLYCKGRRARALAMQITQNWPGSEQPVPTEPEEQCGAPSETHTGSPTEAANEPAATTRVCVALWQLSPTSAAAIDWLSQEAAAMMRRGRSAGRAATLAIRRYLRRSRRRGDLGCHSLSDHPWADLWLKEQKRNPCVRKLARGRGVVRPITTSRTAHSRAATAINSDYQSIPQS
jgi:hypothetical protein